MRKPIALLLLLAAAGASGEEPEEVAVRIRLKRDPLASLAGYMSAWNDREFTFRPLGPGGSRVTVRWEDVVDEDAQALRVKLKLELTEDERLGLISGHRLHFVGGGFDDGLLLAIDEDGRHWLKVRKVVLPYEKDRIERVEEIKLPESEVYDEEELYTARLQRIAPKTAREHKDLADFMFDAGYFEKAKKHYEEAIAGDPSYASRLAGRLAELQELAQDAEFVAARRAAGYRANILNDFDGALAILAKYLETHPDRERSVAKVVHEIRERRSEKLHQRFQYLKHRALDVQVRRYVERNRDVDLQTALSWVTTKLPDDLEKWVRSNMRLTDDEFARFRADRSRGSLHFATFGHGSFVFDPKAKRGASSAKQIRGDPNSWWLSLTDGSARTTFLKAYAAEKLPDYFEVVSVRLTPCQACGGVGQVKRNSLTPVAGVGHEWWEVCRRCFGARDDKAVAYR